MPPHRLCPPWLAAQVHGPTSWRTQAALGARSGDRRARPRTQMVLLEPRTLRLLAVRSNQLSYETDAPVYTPQDKTRAAGQLQPRSGEHLDEVSGLVCKAQARANAL